MRADDATLFHALVPGLAAQRALTDDAADGRARVFPVAPCPVEAIVVAVEPKREPARVVGASPGCTHLILCSELPVDDDSTGVANHRRPRFRTLHRTDEAGRSARARHVPRSSGGDRRRREHFVSNERSVCRAAGGRSRNLTGAVSRLL